MSDDGRIQIYKKNPRYWKYKGKPLLLLGGTKEDNLYQIPDLKEHLGHLQSVGGNYIRNTMSCRDEGNVWPFKQVNGKYNLDQWNDKHWNRFQNMLRWTEEKDIIVQIEVWATYDFYNDHWMENPFNPELNINYNQEESGLPSCKDLVNNHRKPQPFFETVPELKNNTTVLYYQHKFVEKMLSYSLQYENVLYCIDNETFAEPEWGWYWSRYIKNRARQSNREVETTEMYWQVDMSHDDLKVVRDRADIYSFFESSQNSAKSGQENWDKFQWIWKNLEDRPRPINNVKIYGGFGWLGDQQTAIERFWRAIIGGCASARFHRKGKDGSGYGLALTAPARASIKSMRMLMDTMNVFECRPHNDLLHNRKENTAYVTANPGKEYAVYFPAGDPVDIDLSAASGEMKAKWLDIEKCQWAKEESVQAGSKNTLHPPAKGHWAALIQ